MAYFGFNVFFFAITDEATLRAFASNNQTTRELSNYSVLEADDWKHARVKAREICVNSQKTVVLYWQKTWLNKTATFRSMFEPRSSLHIPYTIQVDSKGQMFTTSHTVKLDEKRNPVFDDKGFRIMVSLPEIQGTLTMDESQSKVELPSGYSIGKEKRGHFRVMETEYATNYNLLTISDEGSQGNKRNKHRKPRKPRKQ